MRYIESLTHEVGDRLHATTLHGLKRKVANSSRSQHRGYPDEVGIVPHIIVDPEHKNQTDSDRNLCSDDDQERATTFTACLGFPHLTIRRHASNRNSLQNLVQHANCDANAVLSSMDDAVQTVLHERERLRMKAIQSGHKYGMDEETTLTADPVDKILINAARAAERRDGKITAEGVRTVIQFKRNNLQDQLPFPVEDITPDFLRNRIKGKTCSPPIPQTEQHKTVLLYWMDNPDAPVREVVENTGISRGKFETFRLNRPRPECYNRSYIEALSFDQDACVEQLCEWMEGSSHSVFSCSECSFWTYSVGGLKIHKSHADDHELSDVVDEERPASEVAEDTEDKDTYADPMDADDLLSVYTEIHGNEAESEQQRANPTETADVTEGDTEADKSTVTLSPDELDVDVFLRHTDAPPIAAIATALGESDTDVIKRVLSTLSDDEKKIVLKSIVPAYDSDENLPTDSLTYSPST